MPQLPMPTAKQSTWADRFRALECHATTGQMRELEAQLVRLEDSGEVTDRMRVAVLERVVSGVLITPRIFDEIRAFRPTRKQLAD